MDGIINPLSSVGRSPVPLLDITLKKLLKKFVRLAWADASSS